MVPSNPGYLLKASSTSLYSRICSFESDLSDAKWTKGIHKKLMEKFGTDISRFFDLSYDGGKVAF